ncbi:hypothetical protein L6164_001576 [Bauhinia variegata]|uniref:Uncharacterized protein n=1 Tax=Bauhinia variegata TaxID=167791 RepID=A0ACB9QBB3_BAUVA|nr:hypothetical protein L6164_001576 [Bauhinia variegata]
MTQPRISAKSSNAVSERRASEQSVADVEADMIAFYASIGTNSSALPLGEKNSESLNIKPSEKTQKALQSLQNLFSNKFSLLLHPGRSVFMKDTLHYLLNLSPEDGISPSMKMVILQVLRSFSKWSLDYWYAIPKLELSAENLSNLENIEKDLEDNIKEFKDVARLEDCLRSKFVSLEERKRELEKQINAVNNEIAACKSERGRVAERKKEVFEKGRKINAQKEDLRNRVPQLRAEQEWAKTTQACIESEWLNLVQQFQQI